MFMATRSQPTLKRLIIGTPVLKQLNFPFGTNGKLMVLGVPILKHSRVIHLSYCPLLSEKPVYQPVNVIEATNFSSHKQTCTICLWHKISVKFTGNSNTANTNIIAPYFEKKKQPKTQRLHLWSNHNLSGKVCL